MGSRIAEIGQHTVAHVFRDDAAEAGDLRGATGMVPVDEFTQILGIDLGRQSGRSDEIAEHQSKLPAFGAARVRASPCRRCHCRRNRDIDAWKTGAQGGNGVEQSPTVPDQGYAQYP